MAMAFSFQTFPRLETERFILRKSEERDVADLYELYSDSEVVKYTPLLPLSDQAEAWQEMNWHLETFALQVGIRWLIEDKLTGKVIGTCGFLHYEKEYARTEIGYDLAPGYWRKGIMSEVSAPILAFGFDCMKLHCIEAKVDPANTASIGLLAKLGFRQDSELREYEFEQGQVVELLQFSMLRKDYRRL
ncbi:GNAT family N-acetyltransferase [Paenibacillus sp. LPE1-1-1.1]|uniref:GNAT family N-acetyltransferase n=1 Tax=Paenibacillus sp. LPE1-1-1.1 TaxID=3135230 RepID=UPI0034388B8E